MKYNQNGFEISFSSVVTDEGIKGIRLEKDRQGNITFWDDVTDSYLSWNLSYEQIYDELYECWHERIKSKKYSREAYAFERNIGHRLDTLTKRIMNLSWKPGGYFDFKVHHPERIISAPYYQDRIVEEWLTERFIKPYVERKLHPNNVACRENKGPPAAQNEVKRILGEMYNKYGKNFYFLQCDIQGYYDNLSHDKIKEQFRGMQALGYILFCNIIDDWVKTDGYAACADPFRQYGVPKGNLPSQWIGIMYLNDIDWYLEQREDCEGNVRYMDDFIGFFETKQSCKDCKIKIEQYLQDNDMGVRLHPLKTVYAPISRGFSFCGWHYTMNDRGEISLHVKKDRKKLIKEKYQKTAEDYYVGKLSLGDVKAKLNGTNAFLKQGDTEEFRRYLSKRYVFTHDEESFYHRNKKIID